MAAVDMNKLKTFLTNGKVSDISGLSTLAGTDFANDPQFNFVTKINDLKAKKEFKWDKLGDLTGTFYGKHAKLNPADWGLPSREEVIIAGGSKASNNWDIGMVDESAKAYFKKYFGGNDPHNWALPPSDYKKWSEFMPSMENMMKDLKSFNKQKFGQLFPQYQNIPESMQKEIMSKAYNKFKDKYEVMKKQHQISKKLYSNKALWGTKELSLDKQLSTSRKHYETMRNEIGKMVSSKSKNDQAKLKTYVEIGRNQGYLKTLKYPLPPIEKWTKEQFKELLEYEGRQIWRSGSKSNTIEGTEHTTFPSPWITVDKVSPFAETIYKHKITFESFDWHSNLKKINKALGEDHLPAGLEIYYKNMKGYDE
jgi:hypothetical protein